MTQKLISKLRARWGRCPHPEQCRDIIWNGQEWVKLCGLCGAPFGLVDVI